MSGSATCSPSCAAPRRPRRGRSGRASRPRRSMPPRATRSTAEGFGEAFFHRTGHGIGLEGHEDPYIIAGNREPLRAGMAFSIEPGIYLVGRVRRPHRGHRGVRPGRPDRAQRGVSRPVRRRRLILAADPAPLGRVAPESGGLRYHRSTGRARCVPPDFRERMTTTSRRRSGAATPARATRLGPRDR